MNRTASLAYLFGSLGLLWTGGRLVGAEPSHKPVVYVAYFVPNDREPIPGYVERLDRVMTEVQQFYRDGMNAARYGEKTFRLDRTEDGQLRVHVVRGRHATTDYGRNAAALVRRETKAALVSGGLDVDGKTLVIFQVLLEWRGEKAVEIGPYCGGGNHLAGTAWVYDDERLDPRLLSSKEPGGYYHRPCSLGEFNSHYIGGVAHELGHAFGLPHACQRLVDRKRGTALMGAGNHTYGNDRRGEGRGTFLTEASAMLLAHSRPFAGDLERASQQPRCELTELETKPEVGQLLLKGRLSVAPAVFGIAAYNDPSTRKGDYDAVAWTCSVDEKGRFELKLGELRPGLHELRLRACHTNGATSRFTFNYQVDSRKVPDADAIVSSWLLQRAVQAYRVKDQRRLEGVVREIERRFTNEAAVRGKAAHLLRLMQPRTLRLAHEIPSDEKEVLVSGLRFQHESVGWGRPLRDEVLIERSGACFLTVGGEFVASGLYAHAPSLYRLELRKAWRFLRAGYGLQDGHDGSVVFVVRGDDKELFRSPAIRDHKLRTLRLDVTDVNILELVVENAGDGNAGNWGVWLSPTMQR